MDFSDFYACVLESGQFIRCNDVETFKRIPRQSVTCFLHARYDHYCETGAHYKTPYYQFTFVDENGSPILFRIGDFEIIYIDTDWGFSRNFNVKRDLTIRDCRSGKHYEYRSTEIYTKFIPDELIPLLRKLNQCDGEDEIRTVLKSHLTYQDLQRAYDMLADKMERIQEQMNRLSSLISAIQSTIVQS